jgi:transposase
MQGKKLYSEKLFTSFQLSDRVPEDCFYRRLSNALDLRFVYALTEKYYGKEGQQSIDPVVFFKLILIGYLENLNSNRKIISHSRLRLDILFFLEYDIDEKLPWHSTISRTRALYGEDVFQSVFQRSFHSVFRKEWWEENDKQLTAHMSKLIQVWTAS